MRRTLKLKFIFLYIIFGFLGVFAISAFSGPLVIDYFEDHIAGDLYQDANITASDYLPMYFTEEIQLTDVYHHLKGMSSYTSASVWFVNKDGEIITQYTTENLPSAPAVIADFNPTETGSKQYIIGDYHQQFSEKVITVIAPVTTNFSTKGYLILHKPYSYVNEMSSPIRRNIYIIFFVIFLLSLIILLGIHLFILRPLDQITNAALQYASGNLSAKIPVESHDELGYLSTSLNYMSSQLKDMDDYQKKFIANVSHDFRSPLTSIKGYVEAIADGTIPPEFQEKYLKIILFETERLTDLTRDLLTLTEFDTKELLLDRTTFDLHELIRNTASSFEGIGTTKKVSIDLMLATRSLYAYADMRKIQQVLYNLIDNAIKFSDPDSSIVIETTEKTDKIYVSVKDYGIGIPRQSLNKIWDRFYKTDLSRGKDKKGTGLGLSIVKEIMLAHHENINVISTEGVGTEFIFTLPKGKKK